MWCRVGARTLVNTTPTLTIGVHQSLHEYSPLTRPHPGLCTRLGINNVQCRPVPCIWPNSPELLAKTRQQYVCTCQCKTMALWPLPGQLSGCHIFNLFEDRAPIDFIYRRPIFSWAAKVWLNAWHHDSIPSDDHQGTTCPIIDLHIICMHLSACIYVSLTTKQPS